MKRNITDTQITFPLSGEYQRFEQLILGSNDENHKEAFEMLKIKTIERNKKWTRCLGIR